MATAVFTHDLVDLRGLAGLGEEIVKLPKDRNVNWLVTKDWRETARYELKSEQRHEASTDAISDPTNGVLAWLRMHW